MMIKEGSYSTRAARSLYENEARADLHRRNAKGNRLSPERFRVLGQ